MSVFVVEDWNIYAIVLLFDALLLMPGTFTNRKISTRKFGVGFRV